MINVNKNTIASAAVHGAESPITLLHFQRRNYYAFVVSDNTIFFY
jgi:hypothetical protein